MTQDQQRRRPISLLQAKRKAGEQMEHRGLRNEMKETDYERLVIHASI
jgi:hypothetical protein